MQKMNEVRIYGELKTLANYVLCRYGDSKDKISPAWIRGSFCRRMVIWGYSNLLEVGEYLKSIEKDVNDPDKFEYLMDPSELMDDRDIIAVIWDDIFNENYEFYRRIKRMFPDMK